MVLPIYENEHAAHEDVRRARTVKYKNRRDHMDPALENLFQALLNSRLTHSHYKPYRDTPRSCV